SKRAALRQIAERIAAEARDGRTTVVAYDGHMGMDYVAKYEDATWAVARELHEGVESQVTAFEQECPDGALVLRLGTAGLHQSIDELLRSKRTRVMLITSENPRPQWAVPDRYQRWLD